MRRTAQSLVGGSRGGCLASIALGFIGALLGTWLAGKLVLPEIVAIEFGDHSFPIVWSIIGASLIVAVLSLFNRPRLSRHMATCRMFNDVSPPSLQVVSVGATIKMRTAC